MEAWDVDLAGEVVVDGSGACVTVVGEIDLASASTLRARLDHIVATSAGTVVLDLAGVGFIDSIGPPGARRDSPATRRDGPILPRA